MSKRNRVWLIALLCLLLLAGVVAARALAVLYAVRWNVIAGGGGQSQSSGYGLSGTIGQAVVGPAASGSYKLDAGYWPGVGDMTPAATISPTASATATRTATTTRTATLTHTATPTVTSTGVPWTRVFLPVIMKQVWWP